MKTSAANSQVIPLHPTHYECLGVPEQASAAALAQVDWEHPPLTAPMSTEAARWLAYTVLSDPFRREVYDQYLARERAKLSEAMQRQRFWRRPSRRTLRIAMVLGVLGLGVWWWLRPDG